MRFFSCSLLLLALAFAACQGSPDQTTSSPQEVISLEVTGPSDGLPRDSETNDNLNDNLIESIFKAQGDLGAGIPQGSILGVIGISSQDENEAWFAEEQLIYFLVQGGLYRVVERRELDIIRREQNFHLSGEVDDETAVFIGRLAGAGIVITGTILPYGSVKYLNLRALDVESAQILAVSSRPFIPSL